MWKISNIFQKSTHHIIPICYGICRLTHKEVHRFAYLCIFPILTMPKSTKQLSTCMIFAAYKPICVCCKSITCKSTSTDAAYFGQHLDKFHISPQFITKHVFQKQSLLQTGIPNHWGSE